MIPWLKHHTAQVQALGQATRVEAGVPQCACTVKCPVLASKETGMCILIATA